MPPVVLNVTVNPGADVDGHDNVMPSRYGPRKQKTSRGSCPHHKINNVLIPHLYLFKERPLKTCVEWIGFDWGTLPCHAKDARPFPRQQNSGFPWLDPLEASAVSGQAAVGAIPVDFATLYHAAAQP
mmetsp:Transcript_27672/g.54306  ORF Transcript_27672/g.54306 Transcript_27672/m.54306 type:complete len:127 (-) Transcript_27672:1377-1757(-)